MHNPASAIGWKETKNKWIHCVTVYNNNTTDQYGVWITFKSNSDKCFSVLNCSPKTWLLSRAPVWVWRLRLQLWMFLFSFAGSRHSIEGRVCVWVHVCEGDYGVMTSAGVRAEPKKPFRHSNPHNCPFQTHSPVSPHLETHTRGTHTSQARSHTLSHTWLPNKWVFIVGECVWGDCWPSTADVWRAFCR